MRPLLPCLTLLLLTACCSAELPDLTSERPEERRKALACLAEDAEEDPELKPRLVRAALALGDAAREPDPSVRGTALRVLERGTSLRRVLHSAAAALVLGKGEGIKGAKLIGQARAGVHANRTPLAPVEAVKAVLETTGKSATDLTALLIDESLGLAAIAAERELGIPEERINPRGGALDRGYPGAACAAVALVDLVAELADKGGVGVIAYSAGTGGSLALAFEQVG